MGGRGSAETSRDLMGMSAKSSSGLQLAVCGRVTYPPATMTLSSSQPNHGKRDWLPWLAVALALSAALRLWTIVTTSPNLYPDSHQYLELARRMGSLDLAADVGQRTPLYPGMLLVLGNDADLVRLAQMLFGLAIVAAVFSVIWMLTHNAWSACVGSLLYGLNLAQLRFESDLLTETLTALLLAVSAAFLTWLWADRGRHVQSKAWVAALCAGMVPLARPVYAFVPVLTAVALLVWVPRSPRRLAILALVSTAAFLPMLAWSTYNYSRLDTFGLNTMTGFNLTNKTNDYVQDAPEEYATIRNIYVAFRDAHRDEHLFNIGHTTTDMMAATGQTYPELSRTVLSMNLGLIRTHQTEYWKNVGRVLAEFWKGTGYDESLPRLWGATSTAWTVQKWSAMLLNLIFLLLVGFWVIRALARRTWPRLTPLVWMSAVPIVAATLCALVEDGSNARFGMPTQPLVVCVLMVAVTLAVERRRTDDPVQTRAGVPT